MAASFFFSENSHENTKGKIGEVAGKNFVREEVINIVGEKG